MNTMGIIEALLLKNRTMVTYDFEQCLSLLAEEIPLNIQWNDPYYLLERAPSFVKGEIPCDGTTIEREKAEPRYLLTS